MTPDENDEARARAVPGKAPDAGTPHEGESRDTRGPEAGLAPAQSGAGLVENGSARAPLAPPTTGHVYHDAIKAQLATARRFVRELVVLDAAVPDAGDELWREWAKRWLEGKASSTWTDSTYNQAAGTAHGLTKARLSPAHTLRVFARARCAVSRLVVLAPGVSDLWDGAQAHARKTVDDVARRAPRQGGARAG